MEEVEKSEKKADPLIILEHANCSWEETGDDNGEV